MLTRTLQTIKNAVALIILISAIGCGSGTSPLAPTLDTTPQEDANSLNREDLSSTASYEEDILPNNFGDDVPKNNLSQNPDEDEDESAAWYNDDDIVNPSEEDVSQNPDAEGH